MAKSTTPRGPEVKGTGLVKAQGAGLFDSWGLPANLKVVSFLASHGGHWHAPTHVAWRELVDLPKPSYFRVLGRLEAEEVIEVCTDEYCLFQTHGRVGWRFTNLFTKWLHTPDSPYKGLIGETKGSHGRDLKVSSVRPRDSSETRGTQGRSGNASRQEGKRGGEKPAYAAPRSARRGRNEEDVTTKKRGQEEWEGSSLGEDLDRPVVKPGSPVNRIRVAFREEARRLGYMGPITASVAKQNSQIRWLLDNGYSEETVLGSFRYFGNIMGHQSMGEHNPAWEVYYRNKAKLLEQAHYGRIGHREGEEPTSLEQMAQEQRERRERQRGLH